MCYDHTPLLLVSSQLLLTRQAQSLTIRHIYIMLSLQLLGVP